MNRAAADGGELVLPPVPALATEVFGDGLERAERYAGLLADAGVVRGLIGPREVPRLWERHLINCAVVAPRLESGSTVADVGSGAGLPGMVWAIARPDVRFTLIEPLLRRATFLTEAVESLGLSNVTVLRERAEQVKGARFDVVTARAVAPLDKLSRWCLPLVCPGGVLLALKGRSAAEEAAAVDKLVSRLGGRSMVVATYGSAYEGAGLTELTRVVEIRKAG